MSSPSISSGSDQSIRLNRVLLLAWSAAYGPRAEARKTIVAPRSAAPSAGFRSTNDWRRRRRPLQNLAMRVVATAVAVAIHRMLRIPAQSAGPGLFGAPSRAEDAQTIASLDIGYNSNRPTTASPAARV